MACATDTAVTPLGQKKKLDMHKWVLALGMVTVISFGWEYPLLGFVVPAVMITGIVGSFFKGRHVCGNLCPRGSFFDTYFSLIGPQRPIPPLLKNMKFRWAVVVILMGFMTARILENPGSLEHWGHVFWLMCAATTAVALLLGIAYRPRTWCSFCPIGTLQNVIGGHKEQLNILESCKQCGLCEKSCPMGLSIAEHKSSGKLHHRDCLKCYACQSACPAKALAWVEEIKKAA